jgi:hypothetical protein
MRLWLLAIHHIENAQYFVDADDSGTSAMSRWVIASQMMTIRGLRRRKRGGAHQASACAESSCRGRWCPSVPTLCPGRE